MGYPCMCVSNRVFKSSKTSNGCGPNVANNSSLHGCGPNVANNTSLLMC